MSGRRGGRGGGNQTVAAVANALGIARNEINTISKQAVEPPPLYPVVKRIVLPLEANKEELQFMADLKQEIYETFQNSKFYIDKEEKKEVSRYTDKYTKVERQKFRPDFSRLPDELCWVKDRPEEGKAKRKKLDEGQLLKIKLERLEEDESGEPTEREEEEEKSDSEASENSDQEKTGAVSDDDGEEDNDYINNYFDNGEGYGDAGSDDNMDGDEY